MSNRDNYARVKEIRPVGSIIKTTTSLTSQIGIQYSATNTVYMFFKLAPWELAFSPRASRRLLVFTFCAFCHVIFFFSFDWSLRLLWFWYCVIQSSSTPRTYICILKHFLLAVFRCKYCVILEIFWTTVGFHDKSVLIR